MPGAHTCCIPARDATGRCGARERKRVQPLSQEGRGSALHPLLPTSRISGTRHRTTGGQPLRREKTKKRVRCSRISAAVEGAAGHARPHRTGWGGEGRQRGANPYPPSPSSPPPACKSWPLQEACSVLLKSVYLQRCTRPSPPSSLPLLWPLLRLVASVRCARLRPARLFAFAHLPPTPHLRACNATQLR